MRRTKVQGNVLVFTNHEEDRKSCIVGLKFLKTENLGLWAARMEIVIVQYSRRERMIGDTNVAVASVVSR